MNKFSGDFEPFEKAVPQDVQDFLNSFQTQRSHCPPLSLLRAANAGALPAELLSPLKDHVSACYSCQVLQADLTLLEPDTASPHQIQKILSRLHQLDDTERKPKIWTWRKYSWWTAAGAVSLILGAFLLFYQIQAPVTPPDQLNHSMALEKSPPSIMLPEIFRLDKPPIKLGMAALVWRGSSTNQKQFLKDIAPALDAYRADNFTQALSLFIPLTRKYPNSGELFFYLGISQLFLGKYPESIISFQQSQHLSGDSLSDEVSWYSALACQRMGKKEAARTHLQRLCKGSSPFAARACAALKEI
jgi:tetratricopeptide (TPR) repeat protein